MRRRWHPLGHTVFYGEYENWDNNALFGAPANGLTGAGGQNCNQADECRTDNTRLWGVGVVQEIDAAAMSMWLSYRHFSTDVHDILGTTGEIQIEDFQYVKFGALINF